MPLSEAPQGLDKIVRVRAEYDWDQIQGVIMATRGRASKVVILEMIKVSMECERSGA